jgi:hypothetical protein
LQFYVGISIYCLKGRCHKIFDLRFYHESSNFISGITNFQQFLSATQGSPGVLNNLAVNSPLVTVAPVVIYMIACEYVIELLCWRTNLPQVSATPVSTIATISACLHDIENFVENQSIGAQ